MRGFLTLVCAAAGVAGLSACGPSGSIDESGAVFDAIAPDETITLTGTEPFWGLEIRSTPQGGHEARFSEPGDIDGRVFEAARFAGNNGLGFSGELAGRPVQIAITPGECSDAMSDRTYPFVATVAWGETTLLGCAYTDAAPYSPLSSTSTRAP